MKIAGCVCCVVLVMLSLARAQAAPSLPGRLPPGIEPVHYRISIEPDPQNLTFTGRALIEIAVEVATAEIVLNAANLAIASAQADDGAQTAAIALDAAAQTATLKFARPLTAGKHLLSFDYRGSINRSAAGLFALDYQTAQGPRRMLATQFEPADARRFAPMWDEPGRKATFSLEVTVGQDQTAISNMPVESAHARADGRKTVRFATTPKMSTYLLFLAVGELERHARTVDGIELAVVTRRGAVEQAQFALDSAAQLIPYLNQYFGVRYPLPKLDLVAGPGTSQFFGAMENWGANFFFEHFLLVDPRTSGESDRQLIFRVIAHELAHQWFGDLVTMSWWDDLWLNEGFASWLATKATEHFHPRWNIWTQSIGGGREVMGGREEALTLDARAATHPIVQPVATVEQAGLAFDKITYEKGQAFIGMLEAWMGEESFREGVRRYMKRHAYGNTITADLWAELAAVSGKPILEVARDFTQQPGVPLIRVSAAQCAGGLTRVSVAQERFGTSEQSRRALNWRVPTRLRALGSDRDAEAVISGAEPQLVEVPGCGPVVANAGQASFARTWYAPELRGSLRERFAELPVADQAGLLVDARALGEAGYQPATEYLQWVEAIGTTADPLIWRQTTNALLEIDRYFACSAAQSTFRAWARGRLRPVFERIGWHAAAGESDTSALLREQLIIALGAMDDREVIAKSRELFQQLRRAPESLPTAIRKPVIAVVATHADAAAWESLRVLARRTVNALERQILYHSLGHVRDPQLAQRTLDLALSGEAEATIGPSMIAAVALGHPQLAFDFAARNAQKVMAMVEPVARVTFIPRLADTSVDRALAAQVRSHAEAHIAPDARGEAERIVAGIEFRAEVRASRAPEMQQWLSRKTVE